MLGNQSKTVSGLGLLNHSQSFNSKTNITGLEAGMSFGKDTEEDARNLCAVSVEQLKAGTEDRAPLASLNHRYSSQRQML